MKIVVVCSGGLDSVTLAHLHHHQKYEIALLSVDYGQRHGKELAFAAECATRLCCRHEIADLAPLRRLFGPSSQTDPTVAVPHGHYAAESMRATVVPNRNMVLLAVATAYAIGIEFDAVSYGAHAGDHAIYRDCRPDFVGYMSAAIVSCDDHPIDLLTPLLHKSKASIVAMGICLGVPFERTWSCYEGGDVHCGRCGTCVERIEAFALNDSPDPTAYAA